MGSCESLSEEFKSYMMGKFDMSNLGLLHYFLGLEVDQCTDGIFVSQKKYATDLLKRLNMLHCKSTSTPMNVNEKLVVNDGTGMANAKQFRSIVGGLNYLCHTRPGILVLKSARRTEAYSVPKCEAQGVRRRRTHHGCEAHFYNKKI